MTTYITGIIAALCTFLFVFELLRRGILKEKFAVLWLVVSSGLLLIAIFPSLLAWAARLLGITLPANLLFILAGLILLLVSVQLSFEVSKLDTRVRRLAEDQALLREQVNKLSAPLLSDVSSIKPDDNNK